jgi:hypothetical protein
MSSVGPQVLTAEQEAGRAIATRRMVLSQATGIALVVAAIVVWAVGRGARLAHPGLLAGLLLAVGYALQFYGYRQYRQTLRGLGIRTRARGRT